MSVRGDKTPFTMIALCTYAIWTVGMCNKSDHTDIPHWNAQIYRLIYPYTVHMSLKKDFLATKTKYEMQWPHAKFVKKLTERTGEMFTKRI